MDKSVVFLHPDDIGVHPVVEYLEKRGAFRMSQRDIDLMVESVRNLDFLQPIVVMPAPEGSVQRYWRVAGRLRVEAARILGQTVPCYIREFESEEAVIEAAKTENFRRRFLDPAVVDREERIIKQLLKERSTNRLDAFLRLHPRLKEIGKEWLRPRKDDSLISSLGSLPFETQAEIAEVIENILKTKIVKNSDEDARHEIRAQIEEEIRKDVEDRLEEYSLRVKELEEKIRVINKEKADLVKELRQALDKSPDSDAVSTSLRAEINRLKQEIFEKDSRINRLQNELCEVQETLVDSLHAIGEKKIRTIITLIESSKKSIISAMQGVADVIGMLRGEQSKDTVVLVSDAYTKFWKEVEGIHGEIEKQLNSFFIHLKEDGQRQEDRRPVAVG